MTRLSRLVGVLALLGTAISACGARTGLDVPGSYVGSVIGNEAGSDVGSKVGTGTGTETATDGNVCTETNVGVEPNVPNLYFVLDISTSMGEGNKWENIRPAAASLIRELGPNARFGAAVFPDQNARGCTSGNEIMPLRLGDAQGATANAFLSATAFSIAQGSGTPTASTFQSLLEPKLPKFTGVTFAILATDGGPNCDTSIDTCPIDQCTANIDKAPYSSGTCAPGVMPNCCDPTLPQIGMLAGTGCLDGDATAQAVSVLRAAGVRTYVMGIPGSGPYASVLDQLAVAGGTARATEPRYYAVNSSDETALASGFEQIAAAAMRSCVLTLHDAVIDPNKVNVYVNDAVVPNTPDGWSLMGQTVTLQGKTCAEFAMGSADAGTAPVRVTQGCPTVR